MEMLDNRLKKDSYLSTDRPEVRMDKILENITKDYQTQNNWCDMIG
jgi:hypothetical protein